MIAIISTNRPQNVEQMQKITDGLPLHWYVNEGEEEAYRKAGAKNVIGCHGKNISVARNMALRDARAKNEVSIQVSDDLRGIKKVILEHSKRILKPISFKEVCMLLYNTHKKTGWLYGGVAVTDNALNYTGVDISEGKLTGSSFLIFGISDEEFDEDIPLKEDYEINIRLVLNCKGVFTLNNILCNFPHRTNAGGANDYRNTESEKEATDKLIAKFPGMIKPHSKREGQISLNYPAIKKAAGGQGSLF